VHPEEADALRDRCPLRCNHAGRPAGAEIWWDKKLNSRPRAPRAPAGRPSQRAPTPEADFDQH